MLHLRSPQCQREENYTDTHGKVLLNSKNTHRRETQPVSRLSFQLAEQPGWNFVDAEKPTFLLFSNNILVRTTQVCYPCAKSFFEVATFDWEGVNRQDRQKNWLVRSHQPIIFSLSETGQSHEICETVGLIMINNESK